MGNHDDVMNPVKWYLTGEFDAAYLAGGSTIASGGDGEDLAVNDPAQPRAQTTLAISTRAELPTSTPVGCAWGCLGWDCDDRVPCQSQYTCRGGYCKP